jgi:hypothetical protein
MSFPAAAGGRHFATRFHNLQIAEDDDNCSNSSDSSSSTSNSGGSGSSNSSVSDDVSQWSEGQCGVSSDDASSGHDNDDVSISPLSPLCSIIMTGDTLATAAIVTLSSHVNVRPLSLHL